MNKKYLKMIKKFFVISLFLINSSYICAMEQEEPIQTKALVKQAWREAYEGNFSKSKEYFHNAVNQSDLGACIYLAQEYAHGGLIVPCDITQAQYFLQKVESLKQKSKQEYSKTFASMRVSDPQREEKYWYEHFIKPIETKNAQKHARIQASLYARENPWYQQVVEILKKEHEKEVQEKPWEKKKFKIPLAQEGICKFLDLYAQDKGGVQGLVLLRTGIPVLNAVKVYEHVLKTLNKDYPKMSVEKRRDLFPLVHEWALAHDSEALKQAYGGYWCDNMYRSGITDLGGPVTPEQCEQANRNLLEVFPSYYQVDKNAIESLEWITKKEIEFCLGINPIAAFNANLIGFLVYLRQFNFQSFETLAHKIISTKLDDMLLCALKKPELMHPLEGTSLSLSNLINQAFDNALKENDGWSAPRRAFGTFLTAGHELHKTYQDRIIDMIPLFRQAHPHSYAPILQLIKSPIKELRVAAFKALTQYCTSQDSCVDNGYAKDASKELFALKLNDIMGDGSIIDAYRYFYEICKQNKSILGVQLLWRQLSKSEAPEERKLLSESVHEFFRLIVVGDVNAPQSFEEMVNDALKRAIQTNSIPASQLCAFFMHANDTGLCKIISSDVHEHFKMRSLSQDDMPIKIRCQFLNDLLCMRRQENKSYDDIGAIIERLSDSEFKDYARTLIEILNPNQTYYEYFSKRRKLNKFFENNKDFDDHPSVIGSSLEYYNAFYNPMFARKLDIPKIHKSLNEAFIALQLSEGLIVGYVSNDDGQYHEKKEYRLYACDADDGYAVWRAPFTVKENKPFAMSDSAVYCVTGDEEIVVLNRDNGDKIMTVRSDSDEKISSIAVTTNNILFIIHETESCMVAKLCIVDCVQQTNKVVALPKHVWNKKKCLVGEKMVFGRFSEEGVMDLIVVDNDGKLQSIALDFPCDPFDLRLWGSEHMIFYVQHHENNEHIVCLDSIGQKLWKYEISERIEDFCYAKKTNKLFLLTEHELIALDTLASSDDKRVLWRTPILRSVFSEVDRIVISDDEAMIYGMQTDLDGDLFCFDSQNGVKQHLYAVKENRGHNLIGAYNGKVYVRQYHW